MREKLELSQLDIDFKAGVVHLTQLELNTDTFNALLGDLPLELRSGWLEHAWVTVPLASLSSSLVDHCRLELEGLRLTFAPRTKRTTSLLGVSANLGCWVVRGINMLIRGKLAHEQSPVDWAIAVCGAHIRTMARTRATIPARCRYRRVWPR